MLNRIVAIAALGLFAAAGAQAASQEEWASPNPAQLVAVGQSQSAHVSPAAQIEAGERPDYLTAPAGQLSREAVNADTQRWLNDGLRQYGAGEGGALNNAQTRAALKAYGQHS
ncbi:hypothetical protein CCO03_13635 [Comamonas serinivorans]|uniref:DUF4148 domain-containing protein n=1 Tax=Comamonas serinivorans TaxID=1082851 RepID=A0A1Y0EPL9_9BURK|nr:hypothetical protein [Comamonas serinivorans]ARU05587.1 hypothetical protein CCO03_13635 [Comamonas serinivorans]